MRGNQIFLRPLEKEDLIYRPKWFNDPEINKTMLISIPIGYSQTLQWFERSLKDPTKLNLSICDITSNKVIGMTGLLNINHLHQNAQFYITIGEKEYWGKKIPDEVIPLVLEHGFMELNLNKIYLWTINSNERARKVYERNGFDLEAVMKQHYFCRGKFQDLYQQAVLKEEWIKKRNTN
jgi:RimJ/RimL family protein N-acetyltransferase